MSAAEWFDVPRGVLDQSVDQGFDLIRQLPEVEETAPVASVQAIYEGIRNTLRVPWVDDMFRTLANYLPYLERAWMEMAPNARSLEFERLANRLRAHALLPGLLAPGRHAERLHREGMEADRLTDLRWAAESVQYVAPKLLLVATAWLETLEGHAIWGAEPPAGGELELPPGPPAGMPELRPLRPEEMAPEAARLLEEIQQVRGYPRLPRFHRALAAWPGYLRLFWADLRPVLDRPEYDARRAELIREAQESVRRFPYAIGLDAATVSLLGYNTEQITEIASILLAFQQRLLPELLLDVTLARVGLEDEETATRCRFSVPEAR